MSKYENYPDLIGVDNRPIEPGDVVYEVGSGRPAIRVTFVDYVDRYVSGYYTDTGTRVHFLRPGNLVHGEYPDTWAAYEDDLGRMLDDEAKAHGMTRRAKALAARV